MRALLLVVLLGLTSCVHIGPTVLPPDRLSYNFALQRSDIQQQLLNIVRLRYTDPPYFLSVNNVIAQFSSDTSLAMNVANQAPPPSLLGSANGSVSFSTSPTITYTPLQGEDYITRLLTPVDLSVMYMLLRAGWSVNRMFRIFVQRIGPIENAVIAARATSSTLPRYKEFLNLGLTLLKLQRHEDLRFTADKIDDNFAIKFTVTDFKCLNAKERALLARLKITPSSPTIWLTSTPPGQAPVVKDTPVEPAEPADASKIATILPPRVVRPKVKNQFYVETRTVLGIFNYLSKGVDLPTADVENKLVPMTYHHDGRPFDWRHVTIAMINVKTAQFQPTDAYASVRYRNHWFYIADCDFESKETLDLLAIITGIYQGNIKSYLPVFTVS